MDMNLNETGFGNFQNAENLNGTLSFKSRDEFEAFINSSSKSVPPSFNSLANILTEVTLSNNTRLSEEYLLLKEFKGSSLLETLDENSMVLIDSNLYYLDFENKLVAVTKDYNLKNKILLKEYGDDEILLYGFED